MAGAQEVLAFYVYEVLRSPDGGYIRGMNARINHFIFVCAISTVSEGWHICITMRGA